MSTKLDDLHGNSISERRLKLHKIAAAPVRGGGPLLLHYYNNRAYNVTVLDVTSMARHSDIAPIDQAPAPPNPALVYVASVSAGTRPTIRHSLGVIAGIVAPGAAWDVFPWWQIRPEHVAAIRAELPARYAPATATKMLNHLRGVMRAGWRIGLVDGDTLTRVLDFKPLAGSRLPAGRDISAAELEAIFATCDGGPVGVRDRAILSVLRHGLRRAEVAGLDLADFDRAGRSLMVVGKGNKERVIPLNRAAAGAVEAWLAIRGDWPGPLWTVTADNVKQFHGRRLSGQSVYMMIRRRARQAGIDNPPRPHDWRRTMAGDLLDAGIDPSAIARIMGHSGINLIARYDRRPVEVLKNAVEVLNVCS